MATPELALLNPPAGAAQPSRLYAPADEWPAVQFPTNLPEDDGEPLESNWHRAEISLLIESVQAQRGLPRNYYAGGNMFVYYSSRQVLNRDYRGPDFFVVLDVDGSYDRKSWIVWEEEGRYPDIIIELLSPRTANADKKTQKPLYAETFGTPNYFYYDPDSEELKGFRLAGREYEEIQPDRHGWLWSDVLQLWLGLWSGTFQGQEHRWLRFYDPQGNLVRTEQEIAQQRAESAEAALAQLRARLAELGIDPDTLPSNPTEPPA